MTTSRYRRPANVAVVEEAPADDGSPVLHLALLPDGPLAELRGPAALIWQESLAGDESDLTRRVAERARVDPDDIRDDVESFLADLLERGLIERRR